MSNASTPAETAPTPVTVPAPAPVRIAYSPRGRQFFLTDEMIALRDGIARGLGFVLRPCSLGGGRECWEDSAMDYEYKGAKISSFHCARFHQVAEAKRSYCWPDDAEAAGYAIDKGKPRKVP